MVYNKGEQHPFKNQVTLPNVGREGHTYARYICDNYDKLSDYTCFVQGHPNNHSHSVVQKIKEFKHDKQFYDLNDNVVTCALGSECSHPGIPLKDVFSKLFHTDNAYYNTNKEFKFGAGAQFIVSRDMILKRPKSFYEKVQKILEYDVCPQEGFVIERLWPFIFSHPDLGTYEFIQHND